jgi:branched-chain amino acid transport system permease protein
MTDLLAFTIVGLVTGAAYAIAATGLVVTYATSNVFNMAHGAIGMVMAFLYWEVAVNRGVPTPLALLLVVGILAPAFGFLLDRFVMRRLTGASVTVTLVVTVGLLVLLIGVASQVLWPPTARRVPPFFEGTQWTLGRVAVTAHELLTFLIAGAVAVGLYLLLNRTRTGVAMRAVVDNRTLVGLHGARPSLLSSLAWGLGCGLAALAGILLVPVVQLDYMTLTLLVINAYAAAIVGKLTNLPLTFVGAMGLGLLQSYFLLLLQRFPSLATSDLVGGIRGALPTLFLFAVMLALPQEKLRVGQVAGTQLVRVPSRARAARWGIVLVAAVAVLTQVLSSGNVAVLGQALALSIIMLSLVVLTGYGGQVSLAQMTFVGIGALVMARFFGEVTPLSLLAAGLIAAVAGAIVSIPALRLRGLYLGLGTLAFAVAMDKLVFESAALGFSMGGAAVVERPVLLGLSLQSEQAWTVVMALAFALMGMAVLEVRRGRFGRFLLAIRDSEAACSTLGLDITRTRVKVFALSAGLAGVGGALYGGMQVSVGSADFGMFQSLPLLLLAVIAGVTSVTGALVGGLVLGLLPVIPGLAEVSFVLIGGAAIILGRNPNGLVALLFSLGDRWRRPRRTTAGAPQATSERPEEVELVAAP